MNETPEGVPAQRVINSKGALTGSWAFGSPERMRRLLEEEGIIFSANGTVDLKRYGWEPLRDLIPTCTLRGHSKMGKIGHRAQKRRIVLKS